MSQQHLHLDFSVGARAEMLVGALLALGAPRAVALDALGAVGLSVVGLDQQPVRRGALTAIAARLVIPGEGAQATVALRVAQRAPRRGRTAQPRRTAVLHAPGNPAVANAAAMPVPGALALPTAAVPINVERSVDAWLAGAPARALDIPNWLHAADLPPVQKALAHKAARRLAAGLVQVAGEDARVAGLVAVRALAELTTVAALIDALSPAAITATPIAVSSTAACDEGVVDAVDWPAPSPWLLEVLAGVPIIEHDRPWVSVDPAGAACAWALVHRFGARGVTGFARQGLGAPRLEVPGGALVARALLGPPTPLATRSGERSAEACAVLSAAIPAEAVTSTMIEELRALGALEVRLQAETVPLGARALVALMVAAVPAAVEPLCERLWAAGATQVLRTWADRWTAGPAVR